VPSTVTLPEVLLTSGLKWGVGSDFSAGVVEGVGVAVAFASASEAFGGAAPTGLKRVAAAKRRVNADRRFRKTMGLLDLPRLFEKDLFITMPKSGRSKMK